MESVKKDKEDIEENLVEQECKNCGGVMRFDPDTCSLVCDSCGSCEDLKEEPDDDGISFEGFDFYSLNETASEDNSEALPIYICKSCGAEIITPPEQAAEETAQTEKPDQQKPDIEDLIDKDISISLFLSRE